MFNGFAGKDAEKCEFIDLLPFTSETKDVKADRKLNEPTKETARVFLDLLDKQLLPPRVVAHAFKAKIIERLQAIA